MLVFPVFSVGRTTLTATGRDERPIGPATLKFILKSWFVYIR
jgi:hypothetical protein